MFKISKSVLPSYINQMFPFDILLKPLGLLDIPVHWSFILQGHKKLKQSLVYSGLVTGLAE